MSKVITESRVVVHTNTKLSNEAFLQIWNKEQFGV